MHLEESRAERESRLAVDPSQICLGGRGQWRHDNKEKLERMNIERGFVCHSKERVLQFGSIVQGKGNSEISRGLDIHNTYKLLGMEEPGG